MKIDNIHDILKDFFCNCHREYDYKQKIILGSINSVFKKMQLNSLINKTLFEKKSFRISLFEADHSLNQKFLATSNETILIPMNGLLAIGRRINENINLDRQSEDIFLLGCGEPFVIEKSFEYVTLSKEKSEIFFLIFEIGNVQNSIIKSKTNEIEKKSWISKFNTLQDYYFGYDRRYKKVYEEGAFLWETDCPNDILINFLEKFSNEKLGLRVLDLGCGEGRDSCYLSSKGFEVIGVDISAAALIKAREISAVKKVSPLFLERDVIYLRNLPFKEFDFAINMGCLHMIPDTNHRFAHLKRVYEILKPGGYFLVAHCKSDWGKGFFSMPHYDNVGKLIPGEVIERRIKVSDHDEKFIPLEVVPYFESNENSLTKEFANIGFEVEEVINQESTFAFGNTTIVLFRKPIQKSYR